MLKLNPDPTFTADVPVTIPGQDAPGVISLVFKYRSRKEYNDWLATFGEIKDDKDVVTQEKKSDATVFMEYVNSWPGMEAEFSHANVTIFLNNYPTASYEIFGKYSSLLFGSRVKN